MRGFVRRSSAPDRTSVVEVRDPDDEDIMLVVYVAQGADPFDVVRGLDAVRELVISEAELPDGVFL